MAVLWGAALGLLLFAEDAIAKTVACADYLVEMTEARPLYVGASELAEVGRLIKDPTLSDEARVARVYEIYLNARLQDLGPEEEAAARASLGKMEIVWTDREIYGSGGGHVESGWTVGIPKRLKGTLLMYAIAAHEFEHVLQKIRKKFNRNNGASDAALFSNAGEFDEARMVLRLERGLQTYYLKELGAMKAEWEYLHLFPPEMRARAVELIQTDPEAAYQTDGIRILGNAGLAVDDFLKLEHEAGRYSMGAIRRLASRNGAMFIE